MAEEKIQTKHPLGKSGKNIDKGKYETLKKAILAALRKNELTHTKLFDRLNKTLKAKFAGDINMRFGEHLKSCALQCIAIADVLESSFRCNILVQRDYLIAGSLLADVGKPLEFDKDASGKVIQGTFGQQLRHPFSGVALAYKHGIPGEVMHIIATHSHEGDKVERSIESIIFHHADFVDFDIAKLLGKRAARK